jgi:glucose/arabinose dehydrogenase
MDTTDLPGKTILWQAQPSVNHNGGQLAFGPDGYLYFGLGDGGGSCDTHNSADDLSTPLGTIVRLDVDNLSNYPTGNLPEAGGNDPRILHHGLRNPWRFSFDRGTGDLYIGDVGQNTYEEINVLPAGSPTTDFGWPSREGKHSAEESCPGGGGPASSDLHEPIQDYGRMDGQSVTGGYVYRGPSIPSFQGRYIFADYQTDKIWTLTWDGSQMCDFEEISETLDPNGELVGITSFGEDANGEIYITVARQGGRLYRIDPD